MKNLFTVGQVTRCCNIPRTTLLRLEQRGLVTPTHIDKYSGYRYYDNDDINRILHIKHFLDLNMSYNDISLYYNSGGTSVELLEDIRSRLVSLKRTYDEMKLRIDNRIQLRFEFVSLPQFVYYAKEFDSAADMDTRKNKYDNMYNLFSEVIEKGLMPLPGGPLFIIHKCDNFLIDRHSYKNVSYICCIPLVPDNAPKDAHILPPCKAFSCLYCGGYEHIAEVYDKFSKKIRQYNIRPMGYTRSIYVVAPYSGRNLSSNSYVTRIVVPIADNFDINSIQITPPLRHTTL